MKNEIGTAAGKVWSYLDKNGETSIAKVVKECGLPIKLAQRAIGWLAREDKIHLEKAKRGERIRLR